MRRKWMGKAVAVMGALALFTCTAASKGKGGQAASGKGPVPVTGACKDPGPKAPIPDVSLTQIDGAFDNPVYLWNAGDGSGRLFVVEQRGVIRIIENSRAVGRPFLDIRDRVDFGGEKGLLSVSFHPKFKQNGLFYVDYTSRMGGGLHTVISEFKVSPERDVANPDSERILLTIDQPYANHNGGQTAFGPDGYLYIGMGDGGAGNDPQNRAQNTQELLGKILRLDVNRKQGRREYGIPADNPYARGGGRPEIFAIGMRNPWRFSFDPATGLLYAADVGQNNWEEIDIVEKSRNYGWRVMEGNHCTPGVNRNCDMDGYERPILEYDRTQGVSITGGFVYRGSAMPALCGVYVYSDWGTGRVWGLRYDPSTRRVTQHRQIAGTGTHPSSFGVSESGEMFLVDLDGPIFRIAPAR
ncbi:MAG: PQQ-dependent sugar dehydrogenase [bacterium]